MNPLSTFRKQTAYHFAILLAVCGVIWHGALTADFLSWDDQAYTINNPDAYSFSVINIKKWFSSFYVGNYHPITMASFAIDYLIGGKNPAAYHLSALFIHFINCVLVYRLFSNLCKQPVVALLTAILFALHPVQVESVMWIAERKTLLAGTFSLAAFSAYLSYLEGKGKLILVYIWCLTAMLSKGTAIVLPFSLLAIDLWTAKTISAKALSNKIPIFICSLMFGYIAIKGQLSGGFIPGSDTGIVTRLVLSGAAISSYIGNIILPLHLSAMYPYPKSPATEHYIGCAIAFLVIVSAFLLYRRKQTVVAAGIFFFIVNLLPMLQLVRFGEALMADRYLYISCIGLFFPLASLLYKTGTILKGVTIATICAAILSMAFVTLERNKNWISDDTFFQALLTEHPHSAVALYSVATLRTRAGDYEAAKLLLNRAVELEPLNYKAWYNKATLHIREGNKFEALDALNRCITLSKYPKALLQRSMLHQRNGNYRTAIADATTVLEMEPQNARAWYVKATALEKADSEESALKCFENAIHFATNEPAFYIGHALALDHAGRKTEAMGDLEKATEIAPRNADAHYYLGLLRYRSGMSPCSELQSAAALGLLRAKQALSQLCH